MKNISITKTRSKVQDRHSVALKFHKAFPENKSQKHLYSRTVM